MTALRVFPPARSGRTALAGLTAVAAVAAVLTAAPAAAADPAAGPAAVAPAAAALGAFTTTSLLPVVGDVTGDGVADRLTLGHLGPAARGRCAVSLEVGRSDGGTGAPVVLPLPVRGDRSASFACPDLGVVSAGPLPTQSRLAVGFSSVAPFAAPSVQLFNRIATGPTYVGGFDGQSQPSFLGSVDLDGDHRGDVYELTDQGEGFSAWLLRGAGGVRLWGTPFTSSARPTFARLNADPGTDVVVTWGFLVDSAGVVVVDGHTGATRTLVTSTDGSVSDYVATVADVDGDGDLDVRVTSVPSDPTGSATTTVYRNDSRGSALSFVAIGG